jgi:CheY-like chemotaxis protein
VAQAAINAPDLVLKDVSMPVLDGIEATRLLKRELPALKVLALTSYENLEITHRSRVSTQGTLGTLGTLGTQGRLEFDEFSDKPATEFRGILSWRGLFLYDVT